MRISKYSCARAFLTTLLWLVPVLLIADIVFGIIQWHDLVLFDSHCSKFGTQPSSNNSSSAPLLSLQLNSLHSNKSQEQCHYIYHLNQLKTTFSHFQNIPPHLQSNCNILYTALKHHINNDNSSTYWKPVRQPCDLQSVFWSAAQLNPHVIQEQQFLQLFQILDPSQVEQFVQKQSCHMCSLPSNWHCNQSIAQIALSHCPLSSYACLCQQIQTDENLLLPVVKENDAMMNILHKNLLQSKSFFSQLISHNPHFVKYASQEFRKSFIQMLPLVQKDGHVIQYAEENLKNNQVMLLEAIKQSATVLQYIPESIRANYDFMHKAILLNVWSAAWVHPTMEDSNTLIFEAIRIHPGVLKVVDTSFRKDSTLIKIAALKSPQSLIYADQQLLNDKSFAQDLFRLGCKSCWNYFSNSINNSEDSSAFLGALPTQAHSQL